MEQYLVTINRPRRNGPGIKRERKRDRKRRRQIDFITVPHIVIRIFGEDYIII